MDRAPRILDYLRAHPSATPCATELADAFDREDGIPRRSTDGLIFVDVALAKLREEGEIAYVDDGTVLGPSRYRLKEEPALATLRKALAGIEEQAVQLGWITLADHIRDRRLAPAERHTFIDVGVDEHNVMRSRSRGEIQKALLHENVGAATMRYLDARAARAGSTP